MTDQQNNLQPYVAQEAYESFDIDGNTVEEWRTVATFALSEDARAFVRNLATRNRRLRTGSVHVAYDEARP